MSSRKNRLSVSNNPTSTQNFLEVMENQLSSSGTFSPGFTSIEILRHIQKDLGTRQVNPDQFEGGILFNSMLNDIDRTKNTNDSKCISNAREVTTPKSFSEDIGHSLVLEMKKHCTELATSSQKENGTSQPSDD